MMLAWRGQRGIVGARSPIMGTQKRARAPKDPSLVGAQSGPTLEGACNWPARCCAQRTYQPRAGLLLTAARVSVNRG